MKKVLVLSVTAVILTATVNAQTSAALLKKEIKSDKKAESLVKKEKRSEEKELRKLEGKEVSYRAKQAFYSDFGNIPVTEWERTVNYDKATFTKDGQVMKAFYDADAKLVGTISDKTFEDLPANARKYINEKYKDYSKGSVILFDDNEVNETDMIMYGQQFEDADNYFVEMKKDNKTIILQANMEGDVTFFKQLN